MGKDSQKDRFVFIVLVILFSLYASVYIYKTSYVIEGERYFSLFDDAMISMRYAKNFVEGHGLVMNPGERVEGYTNPVWVMYMAVIHLLPVSPQKISLFIQITGALLLIANLYVVMKIARLVSGNSYRVSSGAMFLTAFYLPLISWSLQGMEVSLVTLLISGAVWKTLQCMKENEVSPWLYVLLGFGTLVRIDMAVPYIGIWLFLLKVQPELRKKNLVWGLSLFIFFMGAQTLFRVIYYGDILPNTYYLKMTGYPMVFRITRGFIVFLHFIWRMNLLFFVLPFIILLMRYDNSRGLCAWMFGLQCLYSIYVGGDAWEIWGGSNRYIAGAMPLFFVLFAFALSTVKEFFAGIINKSKEASEHLHAVLVRYSFTFLIVVCFLQFNNNRGPLNLAGFVFINLPPNVEGNREMVGYSQIVRNISTDDARVAVTWAGALPYFSERYTVDILGKTDTFIAHEEMRQAEGFDKLLFFYPGHLKYNYEYSIRQQKPDIIVQFWGDIDEANPYIRDRYTKLIVGDWFFYMLNNSKNIFWDRLPRRREIR